MKRNFSQIVLLFYIAFLSLQVFTQEKPVALKFDEFSKSDEYSSDSKMIAERLKRFAMQLKRQTQMQALIIGYDKRKQSYDQYWIGDNQILTVQRELEGYGIAEKRIVRLVGSIRENESYELWLLPKGAEMPKPRPEFKQADIVFCLGYAGIDGVYYTFDRNKPLEFSARTNPTRIPSEVNYEWEVSAGKIVEGQGTEKIKVDVSQTTQNYLTVKLSFKGLSLECNNQAVINVTFAKFPFKFAEFSGQGEDFKLYPYYLLQELNNNPQLQAKTFIYTPRDGGSNILKVSIERAKRAMRFMKFPIEKLPFEFGGFRENLTFEMWLYPKGSKPPQPIPTVDDKFIVFPKQIKKSVRLK
jgi:hypothetical protein